MLERTLDDSANRRSILPESLLIVDEILESFTKIVQGLQVRTQAIDRTLANFGPFAAVERVLMALVKKGMDRQAAHALLRNHSLNAWDAIQRGEKNPLKSLVGSDPVISNKISKLELDELFRVESYTGIAEKRALEMATAIRDQISR
jgi:adenylosuccinate lyase